MGTDGRGEEGEAKVLNMGSICASIPKINAVMTHYKRVAIKTKFKTVD